MVRFILLFFFVSTVYLICQDSTGTTKDRAVVIKVTTGRAPDMFIRLDWLGDPNANDYTIRRKMKDETSWQPVKVQAGTDTTFIDYDVVTGVGYEYYIDKWTDKYEGYGYVYAGVELPETPYRGKALLLVDTTMMEPLAFELQRFCQDIAADGWEVIMRAVPRAETFDREKVAAVKAVVNEEYQKDSINLNTLIIFGRVAVPYSGRVAPDSHFPDHYGAWPADVYYCVMDGEWTDNSVNYPSSTRIENRNIPNDGKYDQALIPGNSMLQSGRIDFYNLPFFSQSETELLRRYLDKNHAFRHKIYTCANRALIDDGFQMSSGEAYAATAWMNFPLLVPPDSVFEDSFRYKLPVKDYLWAYGCHMGGYTSSYNTAYSEEMAVTPYNAVFTILFGSYYGDYDSENNLLRAAIASSPSILTCSWSGRPFWPIQHMALGETIGYATRLSQNNKTTYVTTGFYCMKGTHIALMGDPTLRMHYTDPPKNLAVQPRNGRYGSKQAVLSWNPSNDHIIGYNIYRKEFPEDKYVKINGTPVTDTTFTDPAPFVLTNHYLVRAVRLEYTPVGSYYNLSLGTFGSYNFVGDSARVFYKIIPNPVYEQASIYIHLPQSMNMSIDIYNSAGAHVSRLLKGPLEQGVNKLYWDLRDEAGCKVASGVYFLRLTYGNDSRTEKIVVVF